MRFTLKTENYDERPHDEAKIVLGFKFKSKYPDEMPDMTIEDTENVADEEDIYAFLKQQVKLNKLLVLDKFICQ